MAYKDFPKTNKGYEDKRKFWTGPEGCELVAGFRRDGMTWDEVAYNQIGACEQTIRRWMVKYPEFKAAIQQSADYANAVVEASLMKRALGYTADEETWELDKDTGRMRLVKITKKHVPPDTKACLAWLFNRKYDSWRSQQPPLDSSKEEIAAVSDVLVKIERAADAEVGIVHDDTPDDIPEEA